MKIYCFNLRPNPLPDFRGEFIPEPIALEIGDEEIMRIGERFLELRNSCIKVRGEGGGI